MSFFRQNHDSAYFHQKNKKVLRRKNFQWINISSREYHWIAKQTPWWASRRPNWM